MDKILRPFTGTGAVCFPIGKPPYGTCEFASEKCLKSCCAKGDFEYDEELHITHEEKAIIYKTVMKAEPIKWLVEEICSELDGLQTNILYWFGSGDCKTKDIARVSDIIRLIPSSIVQMGFTRNVKLWEQYKMIFALTLESETEIGGREGLFAIPNYKTRTTHMRLKTHHREGYQGFGCGAAWVSLDGVDKKRIKHYANCRTCYRLKFGCFDTDRKDLMK